MTNIDKSKVREIIDDFALEIARAKTTGAKPQKTVINFRNERINGIEREVYEVPTDLLRYRKDNGRIRADVISYEKEYGVLDENSQETQNEIRKMLERNDPEKNDELERAIMHDGQLDPAIITCDGFLINGNRRKMILERINRKDPTKGRFMKVVLLPGKSDPGGPPTIKEIEVIENRYQHQSEGKAEYTKFNKALSIKRKIEIGMSITEQLKDDPIYTDLDNREFMKEVKRVDEEYLQPLICIDRYLEILGREGLYNTIAAGTGDREGRWQAFLDYYKYVYKKITDEKQRLDNIHIKESEIGKIQDIAYKIIRQREFKGIKVHQIMRNLTKWIKYPEAKKELYEIAKIPNELDNKEIHDKDGKEVDESVKDKIWVNKYRTTFHRQINNAIRIVNQEKETETPLELLEAALKKLEDEELVIEAISRTEIPKTKSLLRRIREAIDDLDHALYEYEKDALSGASFLRCVFYR